MLPKDIVNLRKKVVFLFVFMVNIGHVLGGGCLFDFERTEELKDFVYDCDGTTDVWEIVVIDPALNNPEAGQQALTTDQYQRKGCAQSRKEISLGATANVTIFFFVQAVYSSSINFEVNLIESGNPGRTHQWDLGSYVSGNIPGEWRSASNIFNLAPGSFKLQMILYRNQATLMIDNVQLPEIQGNSDQCYEVPRPTTTVSTTTDTTTITPSSTSTVTTTTITTPTTGTSGSTGSSVTTASTTTVSVTTPSPTLCTSSSTSTDLPSSTTTAPRVTTTPPKPGGSADYFWIPLLVVFLLALVVLLCGCYFHCNRVTFQHRVKRGTNIILQSSGIMQSQRRNQIHKSGGHKDWRV